MKLNRVLKRTAQTVTLGFLVLLAVLPLVFKVIQSVGTALTASGNGGAGFAVPQQDSVTVHLVFLFTCMAGILTSHAGKHLSLDVITGLLRGRALQAVEMIRAGLETAVVTALFFSAWSELFAAFLPEDKLWGIPMRWIFGFLPLMYAGILFLAVQRKGMRIAAWVGAALGLLVSTGPVFGVLYSLFGVAECPPLTAIFDGWIGISGAALAPLVLLFVAAAFFGLPIYAVLAGISYVAFSQGGGYVEMISLETYNILIDKSIAAIPLFTLAGYLLAGGSAGGRILEVIRSLFGWVRGGVVIAAVIVAVFFTTFTGASGATILALGTLLTVILTGNGYKEEDAQSLVTATSSIGLLFPPSLAIIIYGTTNIFSVDIYDLFKGALLPGVLMSAAMIAIGIVKDKSAHRESFSPHTVKKAFLQGWPELILPAGIFAGYFSGFFSLIETACFAAVYSLILETGIRRDFSLRAAAKTALKSVPVAGGVLMIIGASKGLAYFLIDAGIPAMLTDFVVSFVHSKYLFLFLLNLLLIVVGCLMDLYSAILVVSPLILPIADSFGIHPVHTGVIFLTNLALGFLTPPVGMNLFMASYTFGKPVVRIIRSVLPYLAVQFIVLMLVTYVPWFSLVFVN